MNKLISLTINHSDNKGKHKIEYHIYTSMEEVDQTDDIALKKSLSAFEWDKDQGFEHPIVRIYNILDEEGKSIDESHIKADMDAFIFFTNNQFEEMNTPVRPIYFTSILDMFGTVQDSTDAVEKYKKELAYECMQFELAGFFNIRAMVRSLKFIPFVYANESARKIYSKLINPML